VATRNQFVVCLPKLKQRKYADFLFGWLPRELESSLAVESELQRHDALLRAILLKSEFTSIQCLRFGGPPHERNSARIKSIDRRFDQARFGKPCRCSGELGSDGVKNTSVNSIKQDLLPFPA
jgi:hypothetical protein